MDPQSPPKRMTRARAAAKSATEPATKTTRIVTAASKAKATRSTATAPTSSSTNKRKTRHDDHDDEDPLDAEPAKSLSTAAQMKPTRATRGRPKKVVDESAPETATAEPIKTTRGRPKKATEPAVTEPPKPVKPTRARKAKAGEEVDGEADADADVKAEQPQKTTRGRAAASTIASRQATRPAIKKTVKFEEPEKENIAPRLAATSKTSTKASEPVSGLRARPIRRPAAAGRTVRGSTKSTTNSSASDKGEKPLPLSPKKVNQLTISKAADSDDELAMNDKPSARSLTRNPIKPPVGSRKPQIQVPPPAETEDRDASDEEEEEVEPRHALIMATPAKRPAPSPWKNVLKSPPKRVEGILAAPVQTEPGVEGSKSPSKMSLLQSPAKRIPVLKNSDLSGNGVNSSPMKMSLLSSPAKRSFTPMKPFAPVVADIAEADRSPAPKPTILSTPLPAEGHLSLDEDDQTHEHEMEQQDFDEDCDHAIPDSPTRLRFPGRLSAVLPRHADPVFKDALGGSSEEIVGEFEYIEIANDEEVSGEPMALGHGAEVEQEEADQQGGSAHVASSCSNAPSFGLREKDLQPYHEESDSEDELSPSPQERTTTSFGMVPCTPCPTSTATPRSRRIARSTAKRVRTEGKFGFTPLADQLSGWTAGPSPLKTSIPVASPAPAVLTPTTVRPSSPAENKPSSSPHHAVMENQYFEDEMMIRQDATENADLLMAEEGITPVSEDIPITEEDVALAAEANEMSLMEPEQIEELMGNPTPEDSISEASQEYGDENAIPIDPALVDIPPVTPQRIIRREFHTVSKIPLKPAAEESPRRRMKTRSHSISRLPVQRPTETLNRSATVISYSAPDSRESNPFVDYSVEQDERSQSVPPVETPQKSEVSWSTLGTPVRTPRRDLDPALLRGAVVFVDVHTSEGADASSIFVDLLSQMGARCVKSWNWNPSSPSGQDGQSSKIGITHVVYKDGGKRTLEKVRESKGVVQCVGVSWVLDCERENQWLDEVPYYIDTALVPRGGARRRKSMEPRALANLNGTLIPTPVRNSNTSNNSNTPSRQSAGPSTPASNKSNSRRRESALWIRTPEEASTHNQNYDDVNMSSFLHDEDDMDWNGCNLTPVPKTPAPEAIARYAATINPDTPTMDSLDDDEDENDPLHMPSPGELMTRTCPPKASASSKFHDMGAGILQREKDEGVLMRLMAARRKSLQFAPKIASPLSKAWY